MGWFNHQLDDDDDAQLGELFKCFTRATLHSPNFNKDLGISSNPKEIATLSKPNSSQILREKSQNAFSFHFVGPSRLGWRLPTPAKAFGSTHFRRPCYWSHL